MWRSGFAPLTNKLKERRKEWINGSKKIRKNAKELWETLIKQKIIYRQIIRYRHRHVEGGLLISLELLQTNVIRSTLQILWMFDREINVVIYQGKHSYTLDIPDDKGFQSDHIVYKTASTWHIWKIFKIICVVATTPSIFTYFSTEKEN